MRDRLHGGRGPEAWGPKRDEGSFDTMRREGTLTDRGSLASAFSSRGPEVPPLLMWAISSACTFAPGSAVTRPSFLSFSWISSTMRESSGHTCLQVSTRDMRHCQNRRTSCGHLQPD